VTKPAFGGDALDKLYITTAMPDTSDRAQPDAGGLFLARPDAHGLPPHPFAG
jgi:sugar lactone lactonase YvrE